MCMQSSRNTRVKRARSPGRPTARSEDDVRAALLSAGQKLFLKHGFERVTARQIAAAAGTTPAMIHYYFENKLGLFRAMLERAIEPFRALLGTALMPDTERQVDLTALINKHMRTAAENPWIATFIVNEVFAEKGRFRATFIRDISSRLLPMLIELLERGCRAGHFRKDLDPKLAALSLLSMCVFPFLARPVVAPVLGLKLEGESLDQLIAHTARLYLTGIENRAQERQG